MNRFPRRKKMFGPRAALRRKRRRRRLLGLAAVVAAVVLLGGAYLANEIPRGEAAGPAALSGDEAPRQQPRENAAAAGDAKGDGRPDGGGAKRETPPPEDPAPDPEQPTPEAAAFAAVAPEMPGIKQESFRAVFRSRLNPSWASVYLAPSDEKKFFVVFARKSGGAWRAEKSVRPDEPDYPDNDLVPLGGVPKDLVQYLYPRNVFAAEVPEPASPKLKEKTLPEAEPAEFSTTEPVVENVPGSERGRVDGGLESVRKKVEGYGGVAGVYVRDLKGGWGYGVRPDETFFSASIIKVPIMVAVYRDIDAGRLSLSDSFPTQEGDWASGAGWLQWEKAGKSYTVEDYLYMMMTQSDNVAANALARKVGGAERVNEVARSLGAKDTHLYQKVSSERAAVPLLDNRTTPRDMAAMMERIYDHKAASPASCKDMIFMMYDNQLGWMNPGLPADVYTSSKAGWLYEVYNEAGIVEKGDRPYVVAILTKYGPDTPAAGGGAFIEDVTRTVWEAQQVQKKDGKNDGEQKGS